jgi:hypothetical protein
MSPDDSAFLSMIQRLRAAYGRPKPLPTSDPLELIYSEYAAYLPAQQLMSLNDWRVLLADLGGLERCKSAAHICRGRALTDMCRYYQLYSPA